MKLLQSALNLLKSKRNKQTSHCVVNKQSFLYSRHANEIVKVRFQVVYVVEIDSLT